ncbi:MAG: Flp1 family type IVb pilin [Lachnospiraceae bacterium]
MKRIFFYGAEWIKRNLRKFNSNNAGVGIVEVILILVILIAIVLIFKDQIMNIIQNAFNQIGKDSSQIIS